MLIEDYEELSQWVRGLTTGKAGGFLDAMARAALHADFENLEIIRPALEQLRHKYPEYQTKKATT